MKRLNENLNDLASEIQFLSFSIDPDRDSPSVLRDYIKSYTIKAKNWYFLTGDEDATHLLAKEFFNGAERNEDVDGGFGHTSYFAIVDHSGLVRGIYDGTKSEAVDKLEMDLDGFNCSVRKLEDTLFIVGKYTIESDVNNSVITITELPLYVGSECYRKQMIKKLNNMLEEIICDKSKDKTKTKDEKTNVKLNNKYFITNYFVYYLKINSNTES